MSHCPTTVVCRAEKHRWEERQICCLFITLKKTAVPVACVGAALIATAIYRGKLLQNVVKKPWRSGGQGCYLAGQAARAQAASAAA